MAMAYSSVVGLVLIVPLRRDISALDSSIMPSEDYLDLAFSLLLLIL